MAATRVRRSRFARFAACCGVVLISASAPASALADAHVTLGSPVTVSGSEPPLLRTSPGFDAPAAGEVAPGVMVTVIGGPVAAADGSLWYLVDAGGYLPGSALAVAPTTDGIADPVGQEDSPAPIVTPPVDPGSAVHAVEGAAPAAPVGVVSVVGTNGAGATCQAAADANAAGTGWLPEGSAVEVTGNQIGGWLPVNCNGALGFLNAAFATWDSGAGEPTVDPTAGGDVAATDPAAPAPLAEPMLDPAPTVAPAPVAEELLDPAPADPPLATPGPDIMAAPAVAVEPTPAAETPAEPAVDAAPTPAAEPTPAPEPAVSNEGRRRENRPAGGGGQAIADFALQFNGYPYVWAGADPSTGFDCSGFTMYVVQQTLGLDISHDMFAQYAMGTPVDRDDLQPGDLVFFQNTFRPGMSHNGIYIGGGQMVHAENESTGVKISDINSDYYSSRWYGAVRFG